MSATRRHLLDVVRFRPLGPVIGRKGWHRQRSLGAAGFELRIRLLFGGWDVQEAGVFEADPGWVRGSRGRTRGRYNEGTHSQCGKARFLF